MRGRRAGTVCGVGHRGGCAAPAEFWYQTAASVKGVPRAAAAAASGPGQPPCQPRDKETLGAGLCRKDSLAETPGDEVTPSGTPVCAPSVEIPPLPGTAAPPVPSDPPLGGQVSPPLPFLVS